MLRDLYGVDVNARGSLIMYCENATTPSPDGQMWTLTIEVGDTDVDVVDLTDTSNLDYMDTDRTHKNDDATAIDDARRLKKHALKELDTNGNGRAEWEEFQAHFATEFKGGRRSNALRAAFDKLDKDGTESLDASEVNTDVVALMDAKDDTTEVFDWIDADGDKELNYTEVWPGRYCSPCHPTRLYPSLLELNGVPMTWRGLSEGTTPRW